MDRFKKLQIILEKYMVVDPPLVSKDMEVPDYFLHIKAPIHGVCVISDRYPLSNLDVDIDVHLNVFDSIDGFKRTAYGTVQKNPMGYYDMIGHDGVYMIDLEKMELINYIKH